jgi:threonine dehydrogenase-like Zn-dependent dehydrogenase
MRRGGPKMSVESAGRQIVAHNYGHGGSGWTLAPGAATYVIDLVEEKSKGQNLLKSSPVAVVGAGVIGLFTAYELVQRGYSNITVIAEEFEDLTSHNAAGLLAPVSIDSTPAMKAVIDRVGIQAYQFYRSVAKGTQRDIRHGAKIVPAYFEDRAASGLEPYVGIVMPPAKDVILDFGNGTKRLMVAYDDSIFMDTAVLMKELRRFLDPVVTFETRKIASLADLSQDIVFDCAGMGSALLNGDSKMVSVQGHLVMLKDQIPQDLQYMVLIYLDS